MAEKKKKKKNGLKNLSPIQGSTFMRYCFIALQRSSNETPVCDHSNEYYLAVLSCFSVSINVQGGLTFSILVSRRTPTV